MASRKTVQHNYDRLSRWYDLFASSEKKFTAIGLEHFKASPDERILEIGFGTGRTLVQLAHQIGPNGLLAGMDISAGMIRVARKRLQAEGVVRSATLIHGDATHLPLLDRSWHGIFLSFTLELFANIPEALAEIKRVLKPGGRLGVVSLAKRETLTCRLYEWGHARWPSVLDCRPILVTELLETAGFQVQSQAETAMWGLPVKIVNAVKEQS